ncbi:MAG: RNA polymerase sigma factor [Planctomycetota bacterium]|jgi:RNA polymerase sigma-70 factor (ECF subfamily)
MEDRLLVQRCKHGSGEALCRIYEKYKRDLVVLAIALTGDTSTAEDIVHDVFVSFAEAVEGFELTGTLKGYLATCVANRARNRNRLKRAQEVTLDEAHALGVDSNDPCASMVCNEELQQLTRAMGQLSYHQREAVILHVRAGMKFREIAKSQGVSLSTAKSRYRYGIDRLRSILNGEMRK